MKDVEDIPFRGQHVRVRKMRAGIEIAWQVESPTGNRFYLRFVSGHQHRAIAAAAVIEHHGGSWSAAKPELQRSGLMP